MTHNAVAAPDRRELARAYIIAMLTTAYQSPDFTSRGRILEYTLTQQMQKIGFSNAETLSALMYLSKMGRVDLEIDETETTSYGQTKRVKWKYYSLSESSLNELEGETRYTRKKEGQIMISNQGGNLVIGDGNIVGSYNTYEAIFNDLKQATQKSQDLTPEQKHDIDADIETIKSQLGKNHPSSSIIQSAWSGLQFLSTVEGVTQFFHRAKDIIEQIIS